MRIFGLVLFLGILASSTFAESPSNLGSVRVLRQAPVPPAPADTPNTPSPTKGTFKELQDKYNLADPVSEDYPIIFNILLFVGVSLTLAVIAISVATATMDPGRDSLIYRVTSGQKMKKDN